MVADNPGPGCNAGKLRWSCDCDGLMAVNVGSGDDVKGGVVDGGIGAENGGVDGGWGLVNGG